MKESHSAQSEAMRTKMQEMMETNESLSVQMVTVTEMQEAREKELKEMSDLKKNRELELSQLTDRFNDLQEKMEDLKLENSRIKQVESELNETMNHLKTDKEEAKEFLEVLQKQNLGLTRQLEDITMKLRQNEAPVEAKRQKTTGKSGTVAELQEKVNSMKKTIKENNCQARESQIKICKLQNEVQKLRLMGERKRTHEQQKLKNLRPLDPKK